MSQLLQPLGQLGPGPHPRPTRPTSYLVKLTPCPHKLIHTHFHVACCADCLVVAKLLEHHILDLEKAKAQAEAGEGGSVRWAVFLWGTLVQG